MSKIILYDGSCNLCHLSIEFVRKKEGMRQFIYYTLQSKEGLELLKKHSGKQISPESVIFIQNNTIFSKSTAAIRIIKHLKFPWNLLYILILVPVPIRDYFYNIIAKYRFKIFGYRNSCILPVNEKTIKNFFYNLRFQTLGKIIK